MGDAVFHHRSEWVAGGSFGEGEFGIPVGHAFGTDEYEVELYAREEVGELLPYFAWEGGFCASAEDEEPDGWGVGAQAGDGGVGAGAGGMQGVAECWLGC